MKIVSIVGARSPDHQVRVPVKRIAKRARCDPSVNFKVPDYGGICYTFSDIVRLM